MTKGLVQKARLFRFGKIHNVILTKESFIFEKTMGL